MKHWGHKIADACEHGRDSANVSILVELHPEYPCSIRVAYEGGIQNPYPWWRPLLRKAWQIAFDEYRLEHDPRLRSSPAGDPVEGGAQGDRS